MWEDRFQSATEALNVLTNKSEIFYDDYSVVKYPNKKPLKSRITLEKTSTSLIIKIPAQSIIVNILVICLLINIFSLGISSISKGYSYDSNYLIYFFITCLQLYIFSSEIHLQIYQNEYYIKHKNTGRITKGKILGFFQGKKKLPFAYDISKKEKEWLKTEIRYFIQQLKLQESRDKLGKKLLD